MVQWFKHILVKWLSKYSPTFTFTFNRDLLTKDLEKLQLRLYEHRSEGSLLILKHMIEVAYNIQILDAQKAIKAPEYSKGRLQATSDIYNLIEQSLLIGQKMRHGEADGANQALAHKIKASKKTVRPAGTAGLSM